MLLKLSLAYSCLFWVGVMMFPRAFASMFTTDAALLDFTGTALRIYMGSMCLFGIQMACQMTFTSLGNAKESITVAIIEKICPSHSVDLYYAGAVKTESDDGCLHGRTDC